MVNGKLYMCNAHTHFNALTTLRKQKKSNHFKVQDEKKLGQKKNCLMCKTC